MSTLPVAALRSIVEALPAAAEPRHLASVPTLGQQTDAAAPAVAQAAACWDTWLQRIEAYVTGHVAASNVTSTTTRLKKYALWMTTGNLPVKQGRCLDYDITALKPGWVPRGIDDITEQRLRRYNHALYKDGAAGMGRMVVFDILAPFYAWHTDGADTVVAEFRLAYRKTTKAQRDTNKAQDAHYTAAETTTMLRAAADRVRAVWEDSGHHISAAVLWAWVEHLIVWLLWGTGAGTAALRALDSDDVDLEAATITWRHGVLPRAGRGTEDHGSPHVQPIPAPLVTVLNHYLTHVRPRLDTSTQRLLVNPTALNPGKTVEPKVINRLLARVGGDVRGHHSATRWTNTYARRILAHPRGGIVALTRLQGRACYAGTTRAYGGVDVVGNRVHIDNVFGADALWQ